MITVCIVLSHSILNFFTSAKRKDNVDGNRAAMRTLLCMCMSVDEKFSNQMVFIWFWLLFSVPSKDYKNRKHSIRRRNSQMNELCLNFIFKFPWVIIILRFIVHENFFKELLKIIHSIIFLFSTRWTFFPHNQPKICD